MNAISVGLASQGSRQTAFTDTAEGVADECLGSLESVVPHQSCVEGFGRALRGLDRIVAQMPLEVVRAMASGLEGMIDSFEGVGTSSARRVYDVVSSAVTEGTNAAAATIEDVVRWFEWAGTVPRSHEALENSTLRLERAGDVSARIADLLASGAEQTFEYGVETDFTREVERIVESYGAEGVVALGERIASETAKPEAAAEALRWLGQMDSPTAYRQRLYVLEHGLNAASSWVRDGASLGLASLDDPDAIPYLEGAIQRERIPQLREDLERVLSQLEKTRQCLCC